MAIHTSFTTAPVAGRTPAPLGRGGDLATTLAPMQEATEVADLFAGLARAVVTNLRSDACLVSLYDKDRDLIRDVAASVVPPARLHAIVEEYALSDFPPTR